MISYFVEAGESTKKKVIEMESVKASGVAYILKMCIFLLTKSRWYMEVVIYRSRLSICIVQRRIKHYIDG